MGENLTTLEGGQGGEGTRGEAGTGETETTVHRVGSELKRLLLDVVLCKRCQRYHLPEHGSWILLPAG